MASGGTVGPGALLSAGGVTATPFLNATPKGVISIGVRCQIRVGAVLATYGGKIYIGNNVSINPYCVLYGHGGLTIGDDTRIATQVVIVPGNHRFTDPDNPIKDQGVEMRGITIGRDVWVGAGARILDGVTIGDGSVVGAGSVVTKDIEQNCVAVGVPARIIGKRSTSQADDSDRWPDHEPLYK